MDTETATKKKIFQTIRQDLTCHICQEIPKSEIYISSIGERTTCVACACNLPEIKPYVRNHLAEKMLKSLAIPCEFTKNGCEKSLDPGTMEAHTKECKFRDVDCVLPCGSKIIISYHGLSKHLAKAHKFDIFKTIMIPDGSNVFDIPFNVKEENFNRPGAQTGGPFLFQNKKFIASMIFHKEKQIAHIYLQIYGSRREAHGLKYKIEIGDDWSNGLISIGPVFSLDDKRKYINDSLEGLVVPYAVMKKYIIEDQLRLKIEIKDDNPNGENKVKKEQTEQPEQQSTDEDSGPETKKVKTPEDEVDEDDVLEIEK